MVDRPEMRLALFFQTLGSGPNCRQSDFGTTDGISNSFTYRKRLNQMKDRSKQCAIGGVCILVLLAAGCATTTDRPPVEKNGVVYGVTEGSFRHRWWNYYERALSFADGGVYDRAELDLKDAVRQRSKDQRRARTYGFHFTDYFPHRELGVVYYRQARFAEAIEELKQSLSSEKSAKAQLYLDRARKALIESDRRKAPPPEIVFSQPAPDFLTNGTSVLVQGEVASELFVKEVVVESEPLRIDAAEKRIVFSRDVPVSEGTDEIEISATDLTGQTSRARVSVIVDRTGPIIHSDFSDASHARSDDVFEVRISDANGIRCAWLEGRRFEADGKREYIIEERIRRGADKLLAVKAEDMAGNQTSANISWADRKSPSSRPKPERAGKDTAGPAIDIRQADTYRQTYQESVYIEGSVEDESGIESLSVDNRQILKQQATRVFFSCVVKLEVGENEISVECANRSGKKSSKTIRIRREVPLVFGSGSRLNLAVTDFIRKSIGPQRALSFGFEDMLTQHILDDSRFNAIERRNLEALLRELKLSESGLIDEDKALELGRMLAADGMIFGSVLERIDSVEIYVRLVDTETSLVIAATDVYGENLKYGELKLLARGMDLKLAHEAPLVQGKVLDGKSDSFVIDIGRHNRIKKGMQIIFFDVLDPLSPEGKATGLETLELGRGRIESVMEKSSVASMEKDEKNKPGEPARYVITR